MLTSEAAAAAVKFPRRGVDLEPVVYLDAAGDVFAVLSNCRLLLVLGLREQPVKPHIPGSE